MAKAKTPFFSGDFSELAAMFDPAKFDPAMFGPQAFAKYMQVPAVDTSMVANAQRKNYEAMAAASQALVEGAQLLARRQAELAREAFDTAGQVAQQMSASKSVEENLGKQAELMKQSYEMGMSNLRELAELSADSNRKAVDVLSARFCEGIQEFAQQVTTTKAAG